MKFIFYQTFHILENFFFMFFSRELFWNSTDMFMGFIDLNIIFA